jgi:hypothetical protein
MATVSNIWLKTLGVTRYRVLQLKTERNRFGPWRRHGRQKSIDIMTEYSLMVYPSKPLNIVIYHLLTTAIMYN